MHIKQMQQKLGDQSYNQIHIELLHFSNLVFKTRVNRFSLSTNLPFAFYSQKKKKRGTNRNTSTCTNKHKQIL